MSKEPEQVAAKGGEHISIHEAMLAVYEKIGYVPKRGKIESGAIKYKFAGEADFIAALRPAMIEAGVYQSPFQMDVLSNERLESVKLYNNVETKTYQHRVVIHVDYKFIHAPSDTFIVVPAFGEAMDSGDKAFNKAMTAANKYALRQAFMIETGDDPDKYPSKPEGGVEDKPSRPETAGAAKDRYAIIKDCILNAETASDLLGVTSLHAPAIDEFKADETFSDDLARAIDTSVKRLSDGMESVVNKCSDLESLTQLWKGYTKDLNALKRLDLGKFVELEAAKDKVKKQLTK